MRLRNHRRKFQRLIPIQKGILRFSRQHTIFPKKIDRTLEHCTPAWLDDILVVTPGDRKDHKKTFFVVLRKLENAG